MNSIKGSDGSVACVAALKHSWTGREIGHGRGIEIIPRNEKTVAKREAKKIRSKAFKDRLSRIR